MASDGSNARPVADSLDLQGSPAWTPDGELITTAANDDGVLYLYNGYLWQAVRPRCLCGNIRLILRGPQASTLFFTPGAISARHFR